MLSWVEDEDDDGIEAVARGLTMAVVARIWDWKRESPGLAKHHKLGPPARLHRTLTPAGPLRRSNTITLKQTVNVHCDRATTGQV